MLLFVAPGRIAEQFLRGWCRIEKRETDLRDACFGVPYFIVGHRLPLQNCRAAFQA